MGSEIAAWNASPVITLIVKLMQARGNSVKHLLCFYCKSEGGGLHNVNMCG